MHIKHWSEKTPRIPRASGRDSDLHILSPRTHVSDRVLSSTRTVGVHIKSTSRSATDKFIKKILVEFLMSFVFKITIGTCVRKREKERMSGRKSQFNLIKLNHHHQPREQLIIKDDCNLCSYSYSPLMYSATLGLQIARKSVQMKVYVVNGWSFNVCLSVWMFIWLSTMFFDCSYSICMFI